MVARTRLATMSREVAYVDTSPNLHVCVLAGTVEDFIPTDDSGPPNTGLHHIIMVTD